ncbi:MAG: twin-arginine translocase subunit TatC [Bacteroidia bacterium]
MSIISALFTFRNKAKKPSSAASDVEMSFLDHLEELRWHLVRSLVAIAVGAIVLFFYISQFIEKVVLAPFSATFPTNKFLCKLNPQLCFDKVNVIFIAISPYEQFLMAFTLSFVVGFVAAFPYIIWEIWRFIKPGLQKSEQRKLRGNVFIISFLFFLGVFFSYYVITPFSVAFLSTFKIAEAVQNQWKIGEVIGLVTQITLGGAIFFELPIVIYYLTLLGVVNPQFLRAYRRHAIVILLIIAAIITPPDILSQVLIFMPLLMLYEISILISAVVAKRQQKEMSVALARVETHENKVEK